MTVLFVLLLAAGLFGAAITYKAISGYVRGMPK